MNKLYSIFALVVFAAGLHAQIIVTNATFPVAGDTLKTATDLNPDGVVITAAGGPTAWDFTGLAPTAKSEAIFRPASEGMAVASFPTATLFASNAGGQGETYYAVSATSFDNLGFSGSDPTGGGLPVQTDFKFTPPVPERRAPLHFIDNHLAESSLNIAIALADLGPLADSLGPIAAIADSIRIRGTASRYDLVDAYGTLAIPGGTYDVLREKRTEYRETRLDIHSFLGWQDITDLILGGAGGGGIASGFGKDTMVTYLFISNTEKEFIAAVNTGSDGLTVQSVEYKDNGVISGNDEPLAAAPTVVVTPNPIYNEAVFTLKNMPTGTYSLRIFDARGAMVLSGKMATGGNQLSLENLQTGTYFYQLLDEKSQRIASGKLLKVND